MLHHEANEYVPPTPALYMLGAGLVMLALGRFLQAVDNNLAHLDDQ